jgi:DNA-3-methyladenine glycosylase I
MSSLVRCEWADRGGQAEREYHDDEWGVPHHGEASLFELLSLEGAQAGLSWSTVLARRDGYRRAFAGFDPGVLSDWTTAEIERLVADPSIIRHRGKIASVLSNAKAVIALGADGLDLDTYLWSFVDAEPLQPRFGSLGEVPATTELSRQLSKDLKARGFTFVGPTIAYAFMQAAGLTNDHVTSCFRFADLSRATK